VVAAAGSVDHDALVELVRPTSTFPMGRAASDRPRLASTGRLSVLEKDTEQAHICYGVTCLNAHHPDRFALAVLDTVLGGGMSSRLFQEIREKKGLAYAVYSFHALYQDTGQFTVYAGTRPGNAEQVVASSRPRSSGCSTSGLTAEDLSRAKESIKGHLVLGLESTRNRMTRLGKNAVTGGELLSVDEIVERVDAVDPEHPSVSPSEVLEQGRACSHDRAVLRERRQAHLVSLRPRGGEDTDDRRTRIWSRRSHGARGRAGRHRRDGMRVVAAVDPATKGVPRSTTGRRASLTCSADLATASIASRPHVMVDFTHPDAVEGNLRTRCRGVDCVVGTTGLPRRRSREIADDGARGHVPLRRAELRHRRGPDDAFAAEAARFMPHVEIIELHHDRKADAPSGTAMRTAALIADARARSPDPGPRDRDSPRVHGEPLVEDVRALVRLPGLVAHQEVSSAGRVRPSRSVTTRSTAPRSCRASSSPCEVVGPAAGSIVGLEKLMGE
jgi:dihydrodipicolinate reductase